MNAVWKSSASVPFSPEPTRIHNGSATAQNASPCVSALCKGSLGWVASLTAIWLEIRSSERWRPRLNDQTGPPLRPAIEPARWAGRHLALLGWLPMTDEDSMRRMSTQQATAAPPRASRFAAALEENGLMVVVLGAFAIVLLVSVRRGLGGDGWLALVSGRGGVEHGRRSHGSAT